jgi:hypothetical protein
MARDEPTSRQIGFTKDSFLDAGVPASPLSVSRKADEEVTAE